MKAILICIACLFFAGCIGSSLEWTVRADGSKTLKINNLKAMVNTQTKSLAMNVTTDGNDFSAKLLVIDSNVSDSPESATAIGDAVTNVMTGGASRIGDNLTN